MADETKTAGNTETAGAGEEITEQKAPEAAEQDKEPAEVHTLLDGSKKDEAPPDPDAQTPDPADEDKASPDAWEPFKLPEGMEYDEALGEKFGAFAKEQGLSQEAAQKFVDFYCRAVQNRIAAECEDFSRWADAQEKSMKDDAEFGGAAYEDNLRTARIGLEKLAPPELLEYVNHNWLGSFKPFVMMCWKAGKLLREGEVPAASPARGGTITEDELAEKMFGQQKK